MCRFFMESPAIFDVGSWENECSIGVGRAYFLYLLYSTLPLEKKDNSFQLKPPPQKKTSRERMLREEEMQPLPLQLRLPKKTPRKC